MEHKMNTKCQVAWAAVRYMFAILLVYDWAMFDWWYLFAVFASSGCVYFILVNYFLGLNHKDHQMKETMATLLRSTSLTIVRCV